MQIRSLRFANLNSLAGSWEIDLGHPAYVSDGIFAITGPTGAGKSTLLDAICLALYGRTPRLDRVTQGSNEIMSRHTGECFAEVTFATAAGVFRCHWSQRRARKKADGALQPPKHEIADAQTGKLLETKIRDVAARVVAVTGMDFERFTRSMLLAQGGFAAFLQADADARAPILEQITGTDIYSRISIIVHERQRAEQDQLRLLQAELQGVQLLAPEQEEELAQALAQKQDQAKRAAEQLALTATALAWRRRMAELQQDLQDLATAGETLKQELAHFQPEQDRLAQAQRAATLDGPWASLRALRQQQQDDERKLQAHQQKLPELQQVVQDRAKQARAASDEHRRIKEEIKTAAPLWTQVRLLDQRLHDQAEMVASSTRRCTQMRSELQTQQAAQNETGKRLAQAKNEQARIASALAARAGDAWLVGNLSAVQARLEQLRTLQAEAGTLDAAHRSTTTQAEQASTALQDRSRASKEQQGKKQQATRALQQAEDALGQLLAGKLPREYRAERDALQREAALLHKIASLEDERQHLQDGQPCPLCGATHHPWATGQTPEPSAVEKKIKALDAHLAQIEQQQAAVQQRQRELQAANDALTRAEKAQAQAAHEQQLAQQKLAEVQDRLRRNRSLIADHQHAVTDELAPLGITDLGQPAALLQTLQQRLQDWQALERDKVVAEQKISEWTAETTRLSSLIQAQQTALTAAEEQLAKQREQLQASRNQRRERYGDKDPQAEEARLQQAQERAEAAERKANEEHARAQQQLHTIQSTVETLQKQLAERQPQLATQTTEFAAALQAAGFADETAFAQARLPADERQALADRAQQLQQQQTELRARQHDRQQQLAMEQAKALSEHALPELEQAQQTRRQALDTLRDEAAGMRQQLAANAQARQRIAAQQDQIEAQQRDCARWDDLHALIGSADGKKYRNFAQGLTFEIMVGHANRELQKMSDRYLLVRDAEQPLVLNVIDAWQADEQRSTQNLSGGESFIVSLALALGLAQMASRNVRIDSLFLDEGFGTLDEQALDTALQALATLQQDGKLIGIISHVAALKERIATQIRVEPRGNGRSVLSGPGCRQVPESESA